MNSKARKITAAILCCTVLAGGAGAAVYAVGSGTKEEGSIEEKSTSEKVSVSNSSDVSKDETVYVIADAEGGVKKIIVSDWIQCCRSAEQRFHTVLEPLGFIAVIAADFSSSFGLVGNTLCLTVADSNNAIYPNIGILKLLSCSFAVEHTTAPPCVQPQCLCVED